MTSCSCRTTVRQKPDIHSDLYKSSYTHSYFYENFVDHPFVLARVKREIKEKLDVPDAMAMKTLESVSKRTFVPKYWDNKCNSTDFFRRSTWVSKPTLKSLHGEYVAHPPRPLKWGSTITGSSFVLPQKIQEPKAWSRGSPIEESTCVLSSSTREGLPPLLPNVSSYIKHQDPYVSTSQFTHCNFSEDQQNGVARKNIMTLYDTMDLPKPWGFGLKKVEPVGSYFPRDKVEPYRVPVKIVPRAPYSGSASIYEDSYDFVPTNLMHLEEEACYPAVYRPSDAMTYCTEQCHLGTGWPVRGSIDIGTVRGTC